MRVEKQGDRQCVPATLAALLGRPLAEVLAVAAAHASDYIYPCGATALAQWLDPTGRAAALLGYDGTVPSVPVGMPMPGWRVERRSGRGLRTLPSEGRGAVRVYWRRGKPGHMMAWEAGRLYDPVNPDWHPTLQEYRRVLGAKVHYYTIEIDDREDTV
jgi:hypothetical protein